MVNPTTSGWEKSRWPPKSLVASSSIFSFGVGPSRNDVTIYEMGNSAEKENNPSRKIYNKRDLKGSDGDYRMVQCKRNGGM